jgi:hypothetical protein
MKANGIKNTIVMLNLPLLGCVGMTDREIFFPKLIVARQNERLMLKLFHPGDISLV